MRVVVGRIGKPHGIHGAVTVLPMTDVPDVRFAAGTAIPALDELGHERTLVVERAAWHGARLVMTFLGVADRSGAEALRGLRLEVDRAADEPTGDVDEFYDTALIGCRVVLTDGAPVGEVTAVVHLPGQDLLDIRDGERTMLVPFVEAIVPQVDIRERRIVIDPPPGLLDSGV